MAWFRPKRLLTSIEDGTSNHRFFALYAAGNQFYIENSELIALFFDNLFVEFIIITVNS